MKVPFDVDRHVKALNEETRKVEAYLLNGKCRDFSEYRLYVGKRDGLLAARDQVKDTISTTNEDDDAE